MIRRLALAAAACSLALAAPAQAYWEYGHETVARIAEANVTPRTRAAIRRLLARQALLATPECPVGTMAEASVWADCVKPLKDAAGKSRFGYAYNWHFQNADVCRPFDLKPACKDGDCVSAQIERDVRRLRDAATPAKAKVEALAFLIHFVGDLHQPLHAGDRGDKGGNEVKAQYGIYVTDRMNLHSVWDGWLAERAITSGPSLVRRYRPSERTRLAAGSVTDWSQESWQVSRDSAYTLALGGDPCGPVPARVTLDQATIAQMATAEREEIRRGGLRLAKLLDRAFAGRGRG